jgi:NAD(P)-dependent dehydrogenase (short-subunit alcohol dehydrogenase family)
MTDRLAGKVALVTGAGSGIGRATAQRFAQMGAQVVVNDVNEAGANTTVQAIREMGGEATTVLADVTQAHEVEALIAQTIETYGRLDYAHNNAGIGMFGPLTEQSEADFDRVLAVNLKGVWLCMKYEIRQFLKQGGAGAIVNTSSAGGLIGYPGLTSYVASKFGVVGLTKASAIEWATSGIRINAICPGVTDTPLTGREGLSQEMEDFLIGQQPIRRFAQPEEMANAVLWLCSDEASFVTGVALAVDGGRTAQ